LATAMDLNKSNCKVFAGCLTRDGVDRFENDPNFQGMAFIMDVTKDEDVEKAKQIVKDNGGLDGLVNNAGIAIGGLFDWIPIDDMKKVFEVNYWGVVRVTKAMLPLLKKSSDGRIVNITSILGRISGPYASIYNSSKYAAEAFSDSLRLEVKPWGVSVHIIEPTFYNTAIANEKVVKTIFTKYWNDQPQETKDEITESRFKSFLDATYGALKITQDVSEVTGRIKHALLAQYPRRRYVTGHESTFAVFMTHLPTLAVDWLIARKSKSLGPMR